MGKGLKTGEDPLNRNGLNLSIVIYWKPRKKPDALANGHAALIIDADTWLTAPKPQGGYLPGYMLDHDNYVSWVGGQVDWNPLKGSKRGGHKGLSNNYGDDALQWGGEEAHVVEGFGAFHRPTRWVAIRGLAVDAMRTAWRQARDKEGAHWRLLDKNCATMVHTILKVGGGDTFATGHKKQLVWWPTDLIRYAKSMRGHVHKTSGDAAAPFM
jgi:hypothetical protein